MAAHRYWKLQVTTNALSDVVNIAEIKGYNTIGGSVDLLFIGTGTATASFSDGFGPAPNAFDNNPATFWESGSPAQYIVRDLGAGNSADIAEIAVTSRAGWGHRCISTGALLWSDDGVTFTQAFTIQAATWAGGDTQRFSLVSQTPHVGQLAVIGIETPPASDVQIGQLVVIALLDGPAKYYSMADVFGLPCWQPCTAFGTEAKVIKLN